MCNMLHHGETTLFHNGMYVCVSVCVYVYVCVCVLWRGEATPQCVVAEGHNYMKSNKYSHYITIASFVCVFVFVCVCVCVCVCSCQDDLRTVMAGRIVMTCGARVCWSPIISCLNSQPVVRDWWIRASRVFAVCLAGCGVWFVLLWALPGRVPVCSVVYPFFFSVLRRDGGGNGPQIPLSYHKSYHKLDGPS